MNRTQNTSVLFKAPGALWPSRRSTDYLLLLLPDKRVKFRPLYESTFGRPMSRRPLTCSTQLNRKPGPVGQLCLCAPPALLNPRRLMIGIDWVLRGLPIRLPSKVTRGRCIEAATIVNWHGPLASLLA
jgi:hypothetical protein